MATKFKMIVEAQRLEREADAIVSAITVIAEQANIELTIMSESVLSLLANIAIKAEQGQPIELMHQNSIAAFLAGVETITRALPMSTDEKKKQNTLRALSVAGLGQDGDINDATFPIVNLGARKPDLHREWSNKMKQYVASGEGQQLAQAIRQLQMNLDRAMRSTMATRPKPSTSMPIQGQQPGN